MPVLAMMIMGGFWFGWTQHQASTMRYALHGAARALVLNPNLTQSQISTLVKNELGSEGNLVNVTLAVANTANGREATLTASYTKNLSIPVAGTYPVSRTSVVKAYLPLI